MSKIHMTVVIRGMGGFGHKGVTKPQQYPEPPKRNPDFTFETKT